MGDPDVTGGLEKMWLKARLATVRRGVPVDEADDLVQEAFVRLERYERDHDVRSREAFVMRTAANLTVDRARRAAASPVRSAGDLNLATIASLEALPDEQAEGRAKLAHLELGLAALPEQTRRILLLRRIDGLSFKEIAAAEGQSVSAVEKQVARATLMLMKWMEGW
jgi:RNA polymerase sigma-70 factor (ECF subfamily)